MESNQPFGAQLIAGDTWAWSVTLPDFDPALFTLKYFFRGPSRLDLVATASGTQFGVVALQSDTESLGAGIYAWQACVFEIATGNRTEIDRGTVEIVGDIQSMAGDGSVDGRSQVKRSLDAICNVMEGQASRADKHYQIAGRSLESRSYQELNYLRGVYGNLYNKELRDSGQRPAGSNRIVARFA